MKIAFVQSGLAAGGAEKIVNLLACHRADLADEVYVLAFTGTREDSYFHYGDNVTVSTFNNTNGTVSKRISRIAARAMWLRQEFKRIRPDVVVSFLTKTNVVSMVASRGLRIPVVISERNNPYKQDMSPAWQRAIKFFEPFAAGLVVQTEAARKTIGARALKKTSIIPNPNLIFPSIKRTKDRAARIVAVGRLTHQKGFDLLLEAFAMIAPKLPKATLTLFGEGPDREFLMKLAYNLKISDRVSFPGLTAKPGAWVAEADVFVLSSRYEGFPNVLIEALAAGLPIIAFACPWGPSEILTHQKDGMLVEPENVNALAAAMHRVLTDAKLREMLSDSAPQSAQRFGLNEVLAKWDSVIDQVFMDR